jgi:multimeric flavodoxin WrbA
MSDASRPIILLASSRPCGNTFRLARSVLSEDAAAPIDLAKLNIGYYAYDDTAADDDFIPLIERIVGAPLWVLATPLHWYSISAQAKTFIDRLTDLLEGRKDLGRRLRGKSLAVVCSGTDAEPAASFHDPLERTCVYLGMRFVGTYYERNAADGTTDRPTDTAASMFGRMLIEEAQRTEGR